MATIKISALPVAIGGDLVATAIVPFDTTTPTTKSTTLLLLRSSLLLGGGGYSTADVLALGLNPGSSGAIRLANTAAIKARNAANSGDVELAQITAANALKLAGIWTFPTADGTAGYVIKTDGAGNLSFVAQGGGGAVSSVFGRTGAVVAAANDYTFTQLASIPTTIGGYGITDFNSLGDARWLKLAGGTLTGALLFSTDNTIDIGASGLTRPRTGYFGTSVVAPLLNNSGSTITLRGVTYTLPSADGSANQVLQTSGGAVLSWATVSGGSGLPTTGGTMTGSIQFSLDNTLDLGSAGATRPRTIYLGTSLQVGTNPAASGAIRLANTGALVARNAANTGDVELAQITAANALKLAGLWTFPTADGAASTFLQTSGSGALSWVAAPVTSVFGRTGAVVAASNDYTFAQLASLPTTIGGYGITDFNSLGDARWLKLAGGTLTGALLFSADNTLDIGASGLTRPRTGYFGTSVVAPNFTGVASSATVLATGRAINGVTFDGSAAITVTAAAGTLTGATLASGVTASSLTTFGALTGIGFAKSAPAISAGTLTLDYTAGPFFYVALNANITTLTLTNWPASGTVGKISIRFTSDGTQRTITYPAATKWDDGTGSSPAAAAPTPPAGSGYVHWVHLVSADALTTLDGLLGAKAIH